MAINFPDPAVTNPFIDHNGREWLHSGVAWSNDSGTAFKFSKVAKDVDFTANTADGTNILYTITAPVAITLDDLSGFKVGDVVTFVTNAAGATSTFIAGGTAGFALPIDKAAMFFGENSIVSVTFRSTGNLVFYGDLAAA